MQQVQTQQQMTYTLEVFEGPLDLLLHLIEQHKIEITDIPIALLLEQYMATVEQYREIDLENLSEFLLMASRLLYIKSRVLLPREEDEEDPRDELVSMLADYVRYKELADELEDRFDRNGRRCFSKPREQFELSRPELRRQEVSSLLEAYRGVFRNSLRRIPPPIENFTGIIVHTTTSVATKVFGILRRLLKEGRLQLRELLLRQTSRSDIVACFMAVLEMSRQEQVVLSGDLEDVELTLQRRRAS